MQGDDDLFDEAETCRYIGGSKPINPATLWRGVRDGRYSRPIKISAQAVRWIRGELRRDRERMIAERDGNEAAQKQHGIAAAKIIKLTPATGEPATDVAHNTKEFPHD